jgi:hypothetical protein
MTVLFIYLATSMAAVLAFPRVWLAAVLAGLIVAHALWALMAEGQEDMLAPVIIMIAIAAIFFLAMLGAITMRRRGAR